MELQMPCLGDYNIKATSSCIRFPERLCLWESNVVKTNNSPASGDLVVACCVESKGAYQAIESLSGENIPLKNGDHFVAVLGNRFSGTNVYGIMPNKAIFKGDKLDLVAIGGIIAKAIAIPGYLKCTTSSVKIIGFPVNISGCKLNISDAGLHQSKIIDTPDIGSSIIVCGTSAEVGKTTLTCDIGRQIKSLAPQTRIGAIKACGTGRIKDLQFYQKAGFDVAVDYVDFGLSTTYGVQEDTFLNVLHNMVMYVGSRVDVVILEIGGDLYEANAPSVLRLGRQLNSKIVLTVNDAMGAAEALRVLKMQEAMPCCIASFKQNMYSLEERLQYREASYFDMNRPFDLEMIVKKNFLSGKCRRPLEVINHLC